ncbi:MAG: peptide chain release factor 1 [Gemmatimonadetes bacterium]|nr:peptide chain release factor 1 [Gemmatimonadota bacterium]
MGRRLGEAVKRYEAVTTRLSDPSAAHDPDLFRTLGRERAELGPIVELAGVLEAVSRELEGAAQLADEAEDGDLRSLAASEVAALEHRVAELSDRARRLLIPKNPFAGRDAVVEIRAGTGGDEAGLFAGDLLRMYRRFAERHGLKVELVDLSAGNRGSVKEAIVIVRGAEAYGILRFESGVHRVQRVPETESQGRVHTSAATVAVLPEAEEVDVQIDPGDLRIDVFRSSGPGGQSVNTTDSAVRVTHLPTGLVVSCQDEKSQHKNKAKALKVLRSRLLDRKVAEQEAGRARARKAQVGTGDRSGKIRTYNFSQNRVTDHRIGLTLHKLDEVLDGGLDELLAALRLADEEERLGEESLGTRRGGDE